MPVPRTILRLALVAALALPAATAAAAPVDRDDRRDDLRLPRPAWAPADPADSLYKVAREALAAADYARAASLFRQIHERYPKSEYAGDAMYYEAFALYRRGKMDDLYAARRTLVTLATRYPAVAKRGDAATLETRVCGELARHGDEQCAARVVRSSARDTVPGCAAGEDDERIAALNALLQMDAERAMPVLRKVIARRDACSVPLRRKAMFLVSQKRTAETEDILLEAARNDPDGEVREQAVFWLSQVGTEKAAGMLETLLRTSKDQKLADKAIFALSQLSGGRGMPILREYAGNEQAPAELRDRAIFWIGQKRSQENADFLRGLYAKTRSRELRERIIFALSQQKGFGNDRWLLEVAAGGHGETELEVRKRALFWAGQMGVQVDELAELYRRSTEREMKEQVIFVYSQRKDPKAVDQLLAIAKSDPDRELRKKAIFWLGQSRDPRAAEFLAELIDR